MPKAHCASYNLTFKLKIVVGAEAVVNNPEIALEEAINLICFCHVVLQVCLATRGNSASDWSVFMCRLADR